MIEEMFDAGWNALSNSVLFILAVIFFTLALPGLICAFLLGCILRLFGIKKVKEIS